MGESIKFVRGSEAQLGDAGKDDTSPEQWAEHYWEFFQYTHPEVTAGLDEALADPRYADDAQSMLDRAEKTVELVLSVRAQKLGAKAVESSPAEEAAEQGQLAA